MLKKNEMATGGQLYQEGLTGKSRDSIPIRPVTKRALFLEFQAHHKLLINDI
ncbi:hypothetical protein ACFLW7_00500 [Chloroflexota bacterium]